MPVSPYFEIDDTVDFFADFVFIDIKVDIVLFFVEFAQIEMGYVYVHFFEDIYDICVGNLVSFYARHFLFGIDG